jgi:hypothetical protein
MLLLSGLEKDIAGVSFGYPKSIPVAISRRGPEKRTPGADA